MEIGAQFFTLRDSCKNLDDFAESLRKVADIGYRTVQISGVCPYEPQWLKEQLDKNGLRCVLTHTAPDRMLADPAKVAAEHTVFGCDYIGIGGYGFREEALQEDLDNFTETYSAMAAKLRENGKYFMYHNHAHEFQKLDGKPMLQWLSEKMPAEDMGFTLDTYWVQAGGGDPAQWLERFTGRVPCIHLKDYGYQGKMCPIGEGNINFDRVFEKAEAAGSKFMLVEQDDCYGEDPFDCLKRSYEYLHSCGF